MQQQPERREHKRQQGSIESGNLRHSLGRRLLQFRTLIEELPEDIDETLGDCLGIVAKRRRGDDEPCEYRQHQPDQYVGQGIPDHALAGGIGLAEIGEVPGPGGRHEKQGRGEYGTLKAAIV